MEATQGPIIRDALPADLPALAELMYQLGSDGVQDPTEPRMPNAAQQRAFAEISRNPHYRLLVLENGGRVVATTILMVIPNLSRAGKSRAIIENVVVDEQERGKQYGERLMAYCLDEAERHGCFKVQLTSNDSRHGAHRFYERLGFKHSHYGYTLSLPRRAEGASAAK